MNRTFYRLTGFFVALLIVVSAIPMYSFVSSGEEAMPQKPDLSPICDRIISEKGVSGTYGVQYNQLPTNSRITLSPTVDMTEAQTVLFDLYIENIDHFRTAVNQYNKGSGADFIKTNSLLIGFSSTTRATGYLNSKTAFADITEQIVRSGWNRVSVSKKDFSENGIEWEKVKFAYLKFTDNSNYAYVGDLANEAIAFANLCTAVSLPENVVTLDFEPLQGTLGENADSAYSGVADSFRASAQAVDFSKKQYVFVDFKLLNFDLLEADRKISFTLFSSEKSARVLVTPAKILDGEGVDWKRLKISVDQFSVSDGFDWAAVTGFSFGLTELTTGELLGDAYSSKLTVAYIYADVDLPKKPEKRNRYPEITAYYDGMSTDHLGGDFTFKQSVSTAPTDWTAGKKAAYSYADFTADQNNTIFDTIEFDLYVEDAKQFASALKEQGNGLRFAFYSGGQTDASHSIVAEQDADKVAVQINCNGWNHICLDAYEDFATAGNEFDFCAVTGYKLSFSGTASNQNKSAGLLIQTANIAITVKKIPAPAVHNRYQTVVEYYMPMKNGVQGDKFDFQLSATTEPSDLTGTGTVSCTDKANRKFQYIEFDLYVESAEEFLNACVENGNTLKLRINSDGSSGESNCILLELPQNWLARFLTNDGWNHFAVICSNDRLQTKGTFDYAKATAWTLYFGGDVTNSNSAAGHILEIANICTTAGTVEKPAVNNKYTTVFAYYTEMVKTTLGSNFQYQKITTHNDNTMDWTASGIERYTKDEIANDAVNKYFDTLEFDFHVDNAEEFCRALTEKERPIRLRFYSDGMTGEKNCVTVKLTGEELKTLLTKDGWNHITVDTDQKFEYGKEGKIDFTKITGWLIDFGGPNASNNIAEGQNMAIANLCLTDNPAVANVILPPNLNNKYSLVYPYFINVFQTKIGKNFAFQQVFKHNDAPTDWTASGAEKYTKDDIVKDIYNRYFDTLEFDFYIDSAKEFCDAIAASAKAKLRLRFYSDGESGEKNCFTISLSAYELREVLQKDGWNHIVLDTAQKIQFGSQGKVDFTKITSWLIDFGGANYDDNSAAGQKMSIANICVTDNPDVINILEDPAPPENVITTIKERASKYLGAYFGYTSDGIYCQGIGPYDFSKGPVVEFDLYCTDAELFQKSVAECERGSRLAIVFSSTPMNLYSQYSKPRTYYSVYYDIQDQITKTGWNHIKIAKSDFQTLANKMDWSNVNSYMLRYMKSKWNTKDEEEKNPAGDVQMRFANVVNTGIVSQVPADPDKPEKPDKSAVYISDCESLSDDYGSWNPSVVVTEKRYKSEHSASVARTIDYSMKADFTRIFYLFDDTANMSDLKELKFDFFIDLPKLIQKSGNEISVGLSADRGTDNVYSWKIDKSTLKPGWNSVSVNIALAKNNGSISLSSIKSIYLKFDQINLSVDNFEIITVGIDNLRYVSKTGNTVLKINTENEETDSFSGVGDYGYDSISTEEFFDGSISENQKTGSNIIHLKQTINRIVTDYGIIIIVLSIEAVILAIAFVIGIILLKKKKKAK